MQRVRLDVDLVRYNPKFVKGAIGLTDMAVKKLPNAPWGTFYDVIIEGESIPVEKRGLTFLGEVITAEEERDAIPFTYHKVSYLIRGGKLLIQTNFGLQELCPYILSNYALETDSGHQIECAKLVIDSINHIKSLM